MRCVSYLALGLSALSLAGCAATSGDLSGDGVALSQDLSVCGLSCPILPDAVDPDSPPVAGAPVGQGGAEPPVGAGNGNSGNTADINSGENTIALEAGRVVTRSGTPSKSKLAIDNSPSSAKFTIDTKTANNALWAKAKDMEEYEFGSNAVNGQLNAVGASSPALGGTYKEYRSYIRDSEQPYDETLQVWTFDDSYVVQYRDETSGAEVADKQAWSFGTKSGGVQTKAAAMPSTRATATYTGQFGSTAITEDWENTDSPLQSVNYNNSWRVRGSATGKVNFTTSRVTATMTPEYWETWRDLNGYKGSEIVDANDPSDINHAGFMQAKIYLSGVVTADDKGNSIKGKAKMNESQGWLSDGTNSLVFGSIYGDDADEITGVFSTSGTLPAPVGGQLPQANPRRGRLAHSGGFNIKKD